MLITNDFEVAQPVDKVWRFFDDIPQVAACLPGAELTEDLGDDKYKGRVAVRMGPVRLQFGGTAEITERDEAAKRIVVNAAGAEEKGRGQASMVVTATLSRAGQGTRVAVSAGPAAVRGGRAVRPGHDLRRHVGADARLLGQHGRTGSSGSSGASRPSRSPPPGPARRAVSPSACGPPSWR